jgi:predicted O-methyltransferase YrrM
LTLSVLGGYVRRQALASDITEYLPLLYGYVRLYPEARVLEIGTRDGNSTLALLAAAQAVGGHVWSVDINPRVPDNPNGMLPFKHDPAWSFTAGDSTDPAVIASQPGEIDVLFIDSGHEYDLTVAEMNAYMPRLAPGGTALFHDTRLTYDDWGVKRALDDYCAGHGLVWRDLPGEYGLGVITLDRG